MTQLLGRSKALALTVGIGIAFNTLSPQEASALTLWYNTLQSSGDASIVGPTGSLDGINNDFYVKGEINNLNSNQIEIILTSNFGNSSYFAGGTPPQERSSILPVCQEHPLL